MTDFKKKIDELQKQLDDCTKGDASGTKSTCSMGVLLVAIIIPIVIGVGLYYAKPNFIMTKKSAESDEKVRSKKWLLGITLVVTIVAWAAMYFIGNYMGYDMLGLICLKSK